ncbi:MAG TPA: histidine phosphatase family protein [Usitatibacter sp.]|jgi:phosphohistidine phosphatase|nr:histidine phosphatase family protein [Usitatibacter sp.]
MELILWRHAEAEDRAKDSDADAARALTKRGERQAERMAAWLEPRIDKSWRIIVSPATRTLQTVAPLDREFEMSEEVGLSATAASVLRAARWPDGDANVLVVGHQPTLGHVAARLLEGREGDVSIRKGAVWWFVTREREGHRETVLKAVVDAEVLGK